MKSKYIFYLILISSIFCILLLIKFKTQIINQTNINQRSIDKTKLKKDTKISQTNINEININQIKDNLNIEKHELIDSNFKDGDFDETDKFVILKSIEGFGDRLQFLLQCIEYSKKTKRILIIDWNDYMWGDTETTFEHYLKLNNIHTLSLKDFLKKYKSNMTIIPTTWKNKLNKPISRSDNLLSKEYYNLLNRE